MKHSTCTCHLCGKTFKRRTTEVKRSERLGKNLFCSLSCSVKFKNQTQPHPNPQNLQADNKRDELTPFRWFVARARDRKSKKGETDLTPEYLKDVWEKQDGICPLSGIKMILPVSTCGFKDSQCIERASIDRIDASKGYIQGNIRFTCVMANFARNKFSDEEVVRFCKAVATHNG